MNQNLKIVIIVAGAVIMVICGIGLVSGLLASHGSSAKNDKYDAGDYHYHLVPAGTEEVSEAPLGIVK